jgi:light-regulated signal transduction histidine kinase (bacteriophytochrome)
MMNENVLGVCVSMIDITERKKADDRFRSQYIEIENNNKELDKLIKVLSHDLRAPMNSVNGLIALAREEKESGRVFQLS